MALVPQKRESVLFFLKLSATLLSHYDKCISYAYLDGKKPDLELDVFQISDKS